jgi:hypothetical protein
MLCSGSTKTVSMTGVEPAEFFFTLACPPLPSPKVDYTIQIEQVHEILFCFACRK